MSGVPVEVSARKINVPYLCPCCCGVADSALAVSFTRITGERNMRETTREIDFPYCSRCLRHARPWNAAWHTAGVVMTGGAIAAIITALTLSTTAGAGVAAAALLAATIAFGALRAKARAGRSPSCSCSGPAVNFHGWAGQVQTFSFGSRRYAAAFAEHNEHSLVNVTPHLYQLVEHQRVSMSPALSAPGGGWEPTLPAAPAPVRASKVMQAWPQRVDLARSMLEEIARIDPRTIQANGLVKRSGRAS